MRMMLNLNNISLKAKIYFMVTVLVSCLLLAIIYALSTMSRIGSELVAIAEEDIPLTSVISEVTIHQLEQAVNFERALRYGIELPETAQHYKKAVDKFTRYNKLIESEIKKGESIAATALAHALIQKKREEFQHVHASLVKIEKEHKKYVEHALQVFVYVEQGKMPEIMQLIEEVEGEEESIDRELAELLSKVQKFTTQAAQSAEQHELRAKNVLSGIGIAALVITGLVLLIVILGVSRLTKGLARALSCAEKIADGQLSQTVESDGTDEIGRLLAALAIMRDRLHGMITQMNHSSTELAASSEELAAVSEESNRNIHQQQLEIQQAATAINEMTVAVREVARHAQATSQAANEASDESLSGQQVVKETVESISVLADVVENASTVIQQVGQDSTSIGTVLDVIKGIAEQTNLLALNAAIEAARAGEQGRGFAVVADEVRTLAQRTQTSTSEIEDMITRLQGSSKNAVEAMHAGSEHAGKSVNLAAKAGASLEAITAAVARISEMNTHIASAADQQTTVAEDINRNVTVISDIAEQSATSVNQITASGQELSNMAVNLQDMISQFEI